MLSTAYIYAQNFSYSEETTSAPYEDLDTTAQAIPSSIWETETFKFPIGFSFGLSGQNYDSVSVKTTGLLSFGNENKLNFIFLNKQFLSDVNAANVSLSVINYNVITTTDNQKILKIEFKNVAFITPSAARLHCSFQVWLKQYSNKVEFHMGPTEDNMQIYDSYQMGFINMNNPAISDLGYLLQGSPSSPSPVHVLAGGEPVSLESLPSNETVYSFLPLN
jgi:hypothetical protein